MTRLRMAIPALALAALLAAASTADAQRFGVSVGVGPRGGWYYGGYPGYSWSYGGYPYTWGYTRYAPGYTYPNYYYRPWGYTYATPGYAYAYTPSTYYSAAPAVVQTPAAAASSGIRTAGYYAPDGTAAANTALVMVHLPADATLTVNGEPTQKTGTDRDFISPPLEPGRNYQYEMTARWMEDGRPVQQTKQVTVRANETTHVTFDARTGTE